MKKLAAVVWMFILSSFTLLDNGNGTLTGTVSDAETGAIISNAKIVASQAGKKVATESVKVNGTFMFTLPSGSYELKVMANGYNDAHFSAFVKTGQQTNLKVTLNKQVLVEDEEEHSLSDMLICEDKSIVSGKRYTAQTAMPVGVAYLAAEADAPYIDYNTEEYDFINENGFRNALSNPLSTFSVDVDRASYSNVRRFLTQNQKPYPDAVRVEELINYFDYSYPQPDNGHPFSVTLEVGECPWNKENELVLVGLKGENINEDQIPPNNLVFLIDVSGSMYPSNKLPLLRQAFKYLVNQLRPQDRVAIVVYAGAAGTVLESTPGSQKAKIAGAIDILEAGGSTAGGEGIRLAYKVAQQNYIHGGNNRIILATDGDFNVGVSSSSELVRLIEEKRSTGVYLTILGFGMGNYKDGRMEQLSNAGNGNYAYIDNIMEAKKMFGTELWGTLYTIANDVKIQVEFNPAIVKSYRLIGYENRLLNNEDFNNDKKDAGEIGCGHTVTALYEIVPANASTTAPLIDPLKYTSLSLNKSSDLLSVKVRYKNPGEDTSILLTQSIGHDKHNASSNLWFASAVAEFGMLLRDSEFKGSSSFSSTLARAKSSKRNDEFGYKDDFIKMVEMAEMLYR